MSKLSTEATRILLKVADLIEINSQFYNQETLVDTSDLNPVCETTCCIAGWIDYVKSGPKVHLTHLKSGIFDFYDEAIETLGINRTDAEEIFEYSRHLPEPWGSIMTHYKKKMYAAKDKQTATKYRQLYATTGAEMIRNFVDNHQGETDV